MPDGAHRARSAPQVVASLGKLDQAELAGLRGGRDDLPALLRGETPPSRPVTASLPGFAVPGDAGLAPRWEPADLRVLRVLTVARFCAQRSELGVAEHWYDTTALDDLLGVDPRLVNDDRLYRALDQLGEHRTRCAPT